MKTKNITPLLLLMLLLISCGTTGVKTTSENVIIEVKNSIELSTEQMDALNIQVGEIEKMNMAHTIETNGTLELPPQNRASVSTIIGGRIKSILVIQGDKVKKGQVLATLENPEFLTMQQNYVTSKNQLSYLEKELERSKTLRDQQINSEKSFAKTESDYNDALFKFKGVKSQLELIGIDFKKLESGEFLAAVPIRSPINGYVRLIEINLGQYVEPTLPLFEIVDNEHLHIGLLVYEKDIAKISTNQNIHFTTSSNPNDILKGKVFAVGKAFEKDVKAVKVYADIETKRDYLIPGMYVNGHIELDSNYTTVISKDAVVEEGGIYYVFCKISDKNNGGAVFEKVEVIPGASEGNKIEINFLDTNYLNSLIVTNGAYYMVAEMKK